MGRDRGLEPFFGESVIPSKSYPMAYYRPDKTSAFGFSLWPWIWLTLNRTLDYSRAKAVWVPQQTQNTFISFSRFLMSKPPFCKISQSRFVADQSKCCYTRLSKPPYYCTAPQILPNDADRFLIKMDHTFFMILMSSEVWKSFFQIFLVF